MDVPTLESERLRLRPFALSDAPAAQRLAGDPAISDTTTNIPHPYPDGTAEAWIGRQAELHESGTGLELAITDRENDQLLGAIGLIGIARGHQAELGYWIGAEFWGRGYCTEAARLLLGWAFIELDLVRVHAIHFARNPASGRVMQKLGMRQEGLRPRHLRKDDHFEDIVEYGLLREDWQAARGALS